jgi:hypothetical protein
MREFISRFKESFFFLADDGSVPFFAAFFCWAAILMGGFIFLCFLLALSVGVAGEVLKAMGLIQ